MSDTPNAEPKPAEPGRARALLSTADMKLLRRALESHARTTEDREEPSRQLVERKFKTQKLENTARTNKSLLIDFPMVPFPTVLARRAFILF